MSEMSEAEALAVADVQRRHGAWMLLTQDDGGVMVAVRKSAVISVAPTPNARVGGLDGAMSAVNIGEGGVSSHPGAVMVFNRLMVRERFEDILAMLGADYLVAKPDAAS